MGWALGEGERAALLPQLRGRQEDRRTQRDGRTGERGAMAEGTELEWAVQVLVNNFDKYSSRCCCRKPRRISKKDFRKMLSCELNHMLTDTGNRRAADKLICDLDENKDGRISFEEYWTLIGGIASPIAHIIRQQEQSVKLTK
ncbi:protein S100-A16 isoform X1 [Meleagris gallopavo]|nr:protein S100-A16 isoform X1 [Meleagris gallopavo]